MSFERTLVYYGGEGAVPAELIVHFCVDESMSLDIAPTPEAVLAMVNRSSPGCLVLDARSEPLRAAELCRTLKEDPFTALVPVVMLYGEGDRTDFWEGLAAGADEALTDALHLRENWLRLERVLERAARDVNVHPTTRLPGTVQIARDLNIRMRREERFAVCYADLDHFKEFNDRYGYANGDRVILLVSRILRDLVRTLAPGGFVGHIGGDDFIYNVPVKHLEVCCDEILHVFDELIPYQYSEEDRQAGYFLGKDRRGAIHRIPLMTLSIGVVTNHNREFSHTAEISSLAGEMKTYAKTLPGSVYVVDRRQQTSDMKEPGRAMAS